MDRRTARILAWSFVGSGVVLAAADLVLVALAWGSPTPTGSFGILGFAAVIGLMAVVVGTLVVVRHPSNPIGWLLCALGLVAFAFEIPLAYASYAELARSGSPPGGEVSAWSSSWIWIPILPLMAFVFLLFPDGRLLSRRWRIVAVAAVVVSVAVMSVGALLPGPIVTFREVENPFGVGAVRGLDVGEGAGYVVFAAAAASLVPRYRRSRGDERAQVRWVTVAGLFVAVAYLAYLPVYYLFGRGDDDPAIVNLAEVLIMLALAGLPLAIGVAILKYRLYEIDVVLNKAVVFGVLAAFITVVYVGFVVGVGALLGSSGNAVLSAVAAAVVALAFQPVRRQARRLANRVVYGERATPYEVLSAFSQRVAASYGADDVLPRMARILGEGTGAARAQVWLRVRDELRPAAVWPEGSRRSRPVPAPRGDTVSIADVSHADAVHDGGELLGALSITKAASDPVTPNELKLVADLAHQAGLVLRNARLVEDLRASRQRLVTAQDQERRRLERNIHDGAQQQLVALAVKAKLATSIVGKDEERERTLLEEIAREANESLESLRDLARGIYPPLLADEGLAAALQTQARKAPMPVRISADAVGRLPSDVEANAYFCCLEALQNAAKYAEGSRVEVAIAASDGELRFEVADDGRGFDPETTPPGMGLQNMSDRLEALGGRLQIVSAPGAGTVLAGRIPLQGRVDE